MAAVALEGVAPQVGDTVSLQQVDGTVSRIEGEMVYVQASSANGQPLAAAPAAPADNPAEEENELRSQAAQVDEQEDYL